MAPRFLTSALDGVESFQPHYGTVSGIFMEGKVQPARKADNVTATYEPIVYKMWEPLLLTAL
jgi:hypothetical protein